MELIKLGSMFVTAFFNGHQSKAQEDVRQVSQE